MLDTIKIRGARTHNLKNIDLDIPRDRLVVITGLSGSGKSSLAFDTIYAEGQRRYVESLSSYARQFLSVMEKPDVDLIEGLSPAISIEQKATSHNPRSTVGTVTEIYDYLRLLFARIGTARCPTHDVELQAQTISQMVDQALTLPPETKLMILAPVVRGKKGAQDKLLSEMVAQGFLRARIDGQLVELDTPIELHPKQSHTIEVVIDRFKVKDGMEQRLAESFETALKLTGGLVRLAGMDSELEVQFSSQHACPECGHSIESLEPRMFSFNSPQGACPTCDGLGVSEHFDPALILVSEELSLAGGAVRGWDRRHAYYYQYLQALSTHYGFDLETPWQALEPRIQEIILHGSGREKLALPASRFGNEFRSFEGVIPNMQRRFNETDVAAVREELAKLRVAVACHSCQGTRLNPTARHVFVANKTLPELTHLSIEALYDFFGQLEITGAKGQIAAKILNEIRNRLKFLVNVGLGYLTLARSADTLSGGEAQRIRLASQIGAGLTGVMYVLDEPSIGLHQRDNQKLLDTLIHLRDLGNSVIVVEHDEDAMRQADVLIDIGPGAGVHGGRVMAMGSPAEVMDNPMSLTGQYLRGVRGIALPVQRLAFDAERCLVLKGARGNNLKNVTLTLPAGLLTAVTGVSGSGKSTLINRTLYPLTARHLNGASDIAQPFDKIEGLDLFDKVVNIDQSPIGRTPRSNPATYVGLFTNIRELFAGTPESRARGYTPGRFSFNVKGGRCEACQGDGLIKVEMHFLADVYVCCDVCQGKRYNRETLSVQYKGQSIDQILEMTVEDARVFFDAIPMIARKLETLMDVGLGYLKLGQSATTLSGGEAQRIKLAKELSKRDTGNTLYILDEPTTGLHFQDIELLLTVLFRLRDKGNTIAVIEHNLDVIKVADWVIDLGPEGGSGGGEIIATGTPEQVAENPASVTGQFLKPLLARERLSVD